MNAKKFAIVACCFIAVIIASMITLGCIKVNDAPDMDTPSKYVVYAFDSNGTERNPDTPKDFNKIDKAVKQSTNLNLFDYMAKGKSLKARAWQDIDGKLGAFKEGYKSDGICLEMIFEEKQSIVVEIDGNTRVIDFTGLIMQVKNSRKASDVALYFSTSTSDTYKSYQENPIVIVAKQNKLYEVLSAFKND